MSKLLFNESVLVKTVLPSLDRTIIKLEQATQIIYEMNIPNNFPNYSAMMRCLGQIQRSLKGLNDLQSWINASRSKLDSSLGKLNKDALLLPESQLKARKEVIK